MNVNRNSFNIGGKLPPRAGRNFFYLLCELAHTGAGALEAKCSLPDGVSQFNIRGWQGRGRTYSADGLVFLRCQITSRILVTCVPDGISAG